MKKNNAIIVRKLKKEGFAVLKKKLSKKNCLYFKKILRKFNQNHDVTRNPIEINYNIFCLNKDFLKIAFDKDMNEIAKEFFTYKKDKKSKTKNLDYHLNYIHHRCLNKPTPPQKLHIDGKLPGANPEISLGFIIYLDDVDKQNGPTCYVPRSHLIKELPNKKNKTKAKSITGEQGTITAFSGSTWHGSVRKKNDKPRSIILINFTRWFIAQNFAVPYLISKKITKSLNDKEKRILGFYNYPVIHKNKVDKKNRKNLFYKKNNIFVTGNAEKVNQISRNFYRKNIQTYKFSS
jgi:hypothetical protein